MPPSPRRQRVMTRSRSLGHCICDPRKPCPCDVLLEHDVCLCAGERLDGRAGKTVQLTKLVKNAGCASKIPPADLARVLAQLPTVSDPRLLIGAATADDAGVFQVSPDLCLVQTVDVFTPSVDDPYTFGRIAACNSLSDVYAMGGKPLTALSIIGYPIHTLGDEPMQQMLKGGMDVLNEAGVVLVGGHSINDEEIKLGFAVTGLVDPKRTVSNAGAAPGDALLLTKPIGTGVIAFAAQLGRASAAALQAAAEAMTSLNRAAAEVMVRSGAHAGTDVTGFGLLGHLFHIVRESGVSAEVWWEAVPLLPEVRDYAAQGLVSGAAERNREFASPAVHVAEGTPESVLDLLYDPQTSGGLLFTVPAREAERALALLVASGCPDAAIIGRVVERSDGRIIVREKGPGTAEEAKSRGVDESEGNGQRPALGGVATAEACCATAAAVTSAGCCAPTAPAAAAPPSAQAAFQQFMGTAFAPGALDVVQKELMTIALSVAVQCEPCLRIHLGKALAMGITVEEIQEAAWMGVAFGGCKAMMFWGEHSRSLGTNPPPDVSK
jgi:selenide,water dikinase